MRDSAALRALAIAAAGALVCALPLHAQTVGYVDRVGVEGVTVRAKFDTGADTSSLDAASLERFERNGVQWIRFEIRDEDGRSIRVERPIVRTVRIKRKQEAAQARPVIRLTFCIGTTSVDGEVNLVDRTGFREAMLIGRSAMPSGLLVDPHRTMIVQPVCRR